MDVPPPIAVTPPWQQEVSDFFSSGNALVIAGGLAGGAFGAALCGGPPLAIPYVGPFLAFKGGTACAVAFGGAFGAAAQTLANIANHKPDIWKGTAYAAVSSGLGAGVAVATPVLAPGARTITKLAFGAGAGMVGGGGTEVVATAISERSWKAGFARAEKPVVWLGGAAFGLAAAVGVVATRSLSAVLQQRLAMKAAAAAATASQAAAQAAATAASQDAARSAAAIAEMAGVLDDATHQLKTSGNALNNLGTDGIVELVNGWRALQERLSQGLENLAEVGDELMPKVEAFDRALDDALARVRDIVGDAAPAYGVAPRTAAPVVPPRIMTASPVHPDIHVPTELAHVKPEHVQRLMEIDPHTVQTDSWDDYVKILDVRVEQLTRSKPPPQSIGSNPGRVQSSQLYDNLRAELYGNVRQSLKPRSSADPVSWPEGFKPLDAIDNLNELEQRIQSVEALADDVAKVVDDVDGHGPRATSQAEADHYGAMQEQLAIYLDMAKARLARLHAGGATPAITATPLPQVDPIVESLVKETQLTRELAETFPFFDDPNRLATVIEKHETAIRASLKLADRYVKAGMSPDNPLLLALTEHRKELEALLIKGAARMDELLGFKPPPTAAPEPISISPEALDQMRQDAIDEIAGLFNETPAQAEAYLRGLGFDVKNQDVATLRVFLNDPQQAIKELHNARHPTGLSASGSWNNPPMDVLTRRPELQSACADLMNIRSFANHDFGSGRPPPPGSNLGNYKPLSALNEFDELGARYRQLEEGLVELTDAIDAIKADPSSNVRLDVAEGFRIMLVDYQQAVAQKFNDLLKDL